MDRDKRIKKAPKGKKKLFRIIILLVLLAIIGTGIHFYRQYMEERQKRIELEEQRRREEEERERQRKLLEQKRIEFDALVEEMKKYYAAGDFEKAREIARKALALAKEYNFPTDEIYRILNLMDVADYTTRLNELRKMNEDIYKYQYVRIEVFKIPGWPELKTLKEKVLQKTYENEYLVMLALAKEYALTGKKGELVTHHYFISREYLKKAIVLRQERNISKVSEEDEVRELQKELFFSSRELMQETIPSGLY
jgi:tetratricopeptide (TPR) repeat protein